VENSEPVHNLNCRKAENSYFTFLLPQCLCHSIQNTKANFKKTAFRLKFHYLDSSKRQCQLIPVLGTNNDFEAVSLKFAISK